MGGESLCEGPPSLRSHAFGALANPEYSVADRRAALLRFTASCQDGGALNSLTSACGQRTYDHAISEFVAWYGGIVGKRVRAPAQS